MPVAALVGIACGKVETNAGIDAPPTSQATLVISNAGGGFVTSAPAGINCGADCSESFAVGTAVTLTATPDATSSFAGWSGGGCTGTGACVVTLAGDTAVTATFSAMPVLSVVKSGTGDGVVLSAPGGINCGADCSEPYAAGTMVTLTAMADPISRFIGWTGGGCAGTGPCVVTLTAATTVTASFQKNQYALDVTLSGGGSGTVTSSPAGINCGSDCTETYDHGTAVTLTAAAGANSSFLGWTGACTGTGTCTVTITQQTSVTANFAINQAGLTVMKTGAGSGTVTSSPAGIACGADCSEAYNVGTVVTLTAAAGSGSTFTGWSGGGCSGTGTCTVTIMGATVVTANFDAVPVTLTVTRSGTGSGTVTSSPAGIACGADCSEAYASGTVVTLTAASAAGGTFSGWSGGGCTGTGTCTVTLTAATTVNAAFACSGTTTFTHTGSMQTFTVPACASSITIDAYGAEGGVSTGESGGQNVLGGRGARARGTVAVTGGQVLNVLVGGRGLNGNCGSGGGGGSFVVRGTAALVVAGGGGGGFHCNALGVALGSPGQITTAGAGGSCTMMPGFDRPPAPGGTNGNGGFSAFGGGGGGFLSAGTGQFEPMNGGGGYPGAGGTPAGGYGGGGGNYSSCCGGSGGGGGYSGGSGGMDDGCAGGGGGSFNAGTNQIMTSGAQSGNGVVTISW